MKRRSFLARSAAIAVGGATLFRAPFASGDGLPVTPPAPLDPGVARDWLKRWEQSIIKSSRQRYCDRETGEEIGWLVSPFLNGFYEGYRATGDVAWIEKLADWAEAWIRRGIKEPDGFIGWPKAGSGGAVASAYLTDSLLGEAMGLRPLVLMARDVLKTPALQESHRKRAQDWLALAEKMFQKWDARGCWREVTDGGLWVVPSFGIDAKTREWTEGYAQRAKDGFSNPANKQNHIARWLLAMHDATGKPVYRERAERWFKLMRSRMKTRDGGRYFVWNYWDPAGSWDYKPDGSARHWIGVHPNGGYYAIDVEGVVTAFEHGLVFDKTDLERLIRTNRDFMWNQKVEGAAFQRIDGGRPDARWKNSPGVLWTALVPHDPTLRRIFLANHRPDSWGGIASTPWFLARVGVLRPRKP